MAGGFDLQTAQTFIQSTHQKWLAKTGRYPWINALTRHSYMLNRMFKRGPIKVSSGKDIRATVLLTGEQNATWLLPGETLPLRGATSTVEATSPWRFLYGDWFLSQQEIELNKDPEQIYDLPQMVKEQILTGLCENLENTWLALDGNVGEFATGGTKMQGLKYWVTYDGLAVDFLNDPTVGGINPSTNPRWKNQFITPRGSSDIDGVSRPIGSVEDLRQAMERMVDMTRFVTPDGYAGISHVETTKPDPNRDEFVITCDWATYQNYKQLLFDRRDDVSRDQYQGRPMWNGIPIEFAEGLGIGANGVYKDSAGNTLVTRTAGGDSPAAGEWPNTGEMYFCNLRGLNMWCHPKYSPGFIPPFRPQHQHGIGNYVTWWLNSISRARHLNGVIAGFPNAIAA